MNYKRNALQPCLFRSRVSTRSRRSRTRRQHYSRRRWEYSSHRARRWHPQPCIDPLASWQGHRLGSRRLWWRHGGCALRPGRSCFAFSVGSLPSTLSFATHLSCWPFATHLSRPFWMPFARALWGTHVAPHALSGLYGSKLPWLKVCVGIVAPVRHLCVCALRAKPLPWNSINGSVQACRAHPLTPHRIKQLHLSRLGRFKAAAAGASKATPCAWHSTHKSNEHAHHAQEFSPVPSQMSADWQRQACHSGKQNWLRTQTASGYRPR